MGALTGNAIGFKKRKDYTNTLGSDIIIIENKGKKRDNNFNNSNNNKDYRKIKISKPNKYYSK